MEIKKVYDLEVGNKLLHIALTEEEVLSLMQAGLHFLMSMGWTTFKTAPDSELDLNIPEEATRQ